MVEIEEEVAEEVEVEIVGEEVEEEPEDHPEEDLGSSSNPIDCLESTLLKVDLKMPLSPRTLFLGKVSTTKKESVLKLMDKRLSTESGIPSDQKSLLQSLEVLPKQESSQELRFSIWEVLQEQLFPMYQILLALKVLFTQLNSLTELEEILSTWLKRETTSSQLSMMLENLKITDSWLVWSMLCSLMLPNLIRPESCGKIATCIWRTEESSWSPWKLTVSTQQTNPKLCSLTKSTNWKNMV